MKSREEWMKHYKEELKNGKDVTFDHRGNGGNDGLSILRFRHGTLITLRYARGGDTYDERVVTVGEANQILEKKVDATIKYQNEKNQLENWLNS